MSIEANNSLYTYTYCKSINATLINKNKFNFSGAENFYLRYMTVQSVFETYILKMYIFSYVIDAIFFLVEYISNIERNIEYKIFSLFISITKNNEVF